ncbi:hypothetical protein CC2G_008286 [Coprinopsis cinerea AmutBmut pab1-1]|nr:hypothetical protein CC2G_008286 [Coprinopsis cinerea AmutBmut pab1-1]
MTYRAGEFEKKRQPGVMTDIFDGQHYQRLKKTSITIDKKTSAPRSSPIAATLPLDSRPTVLPLSEGVATRHGLSFYSTTTSLPTFASTLTVSLRSVDYYLWPAILEFRKLMRGVKAFDGLSLEFFILRPFLIAVFGDIPAVSMLMQMKGHNGISPCPVRSNPSACKTYKANALPMRSHDELLRQAREVQSSSTNADADRLANKYGVKSVPILSQLSSLDFPTSFPYDFMHLIWENVIKNLVLHWTGNFKGLDDGSESYQFAPSVWNAIGEATHAAGKTIPAVYGPRLPDIANERGNYITADMWSFWTLYIAPVLLRRRFKETRYYRHFVQLVRILKMCLQFEITNEDIDEIRCEIIEWVEKYEHTSTEAHYQPSWIFAPKLSDLCSTTAVSSFRLR